VVLIKRKGADYMSAKMWGNGYRTTMICIDSYNNSVPVGRFYNQYCPDGILFHGAIDLVKKMDAMLDQMGAPQSFSRVRSFSENPAASVSAPSGEFICKGEVATFATEELGRLALGGN
jgi:hypothetical protein